MMRSVAAAIDPPWITVGSAAKVDVYILWADIDLTQGASIGGRAETLRQGGVPMGSLPKVPGLLVPGGTVYKGFIPLCSCSVKSLSMQ